MAEEKEEAAPAEAVPAPKKSKKMLIIAIAVPVILAAIGVPAALILTKKTEIETPDMVSKLDAGAAITKESDLEADDADEGEEALGAIYPLETFVVNLSKGGFLRAQFQVEFADRDIPIRFYSRIVPMRDRAIELIGTKTAEELLTPRGRDDLKREIKDAMNELLRREDIKHMYVTQFVIQGVPG